MAVAFLVKGKMPRTKQTRPKRRTRKSKRVKSSSFTGHPAGSGFLGDQGAFAHMAVGLK